CGSRLAAAPEIESAAPGIESEPPVGYDDFKLLSVGEQIETALNLYCADAAAWRARPSPAYRNSDFDIAMKYIEIINGSEKTEEIKERALDRLSRLDAIDFTETDAFYFLARLLKNHITEYEYVMLYRRKLYEQLHLYKLINYNAIEMNEIMERLEYPINGKEAHIYTGEDGWNGEIYVYNKYTAMGFEDLRYDDYLMEGFKRLDAEAQIQHIWNELRKRAGSRGPLSPFLLYKMEALMEKREETIPWMYSFLRNTREEEKEDSYSNFSLTIYMLNYLTNRRLLLNDNEKRECADVYRQKLDEYIRNYRKVTGAMMNRYVMINYLDTGIWIEDKKEWEGIADLLKAKYKESGYEIKGP
ncbi:MAG: hypothetical protein LBI67_02845, partial [Treponema sp.]|nr:hypothetical protein [Treponema sp.]